MNNIDQRGKADAGMGQEQSSRAQPEAAITPPIQQSDIGQSLNGLAGKSVRSYMVDDSMITEFLALQSCSPAEKKAMRATIEKWETYRVKMVAAREIQVAA